MYVLYLSVISFEAVAVFGKLGALARFSKVSNEDPIPEFLYPVYFLKQPEPDNGNFHPDPKHSLSNYNPNGTKRESDKPL